MISSSPNNIVLVLMLTAFLTDNTQGCDSIRNTTTNRYKAQKPEDRCGKCGTPIDFTLMVRNVLVEPTFDFNITLLAQPQRELIFLLERAAQLDGNFKFSATYYSQWGYFLNSIGGQASSSENKHYWMFSDYKSGDDLTCGLSSHIPQHQDVVLFNLTSITGH